jgi:hypothetical protein
MSKACLSPQHTDAEQLNLKNEKFAYHLPNLHSMCLSWQHLPEMQLLPPPKSPTSKFISLSATFETSSHSG